LRYQIMNFYGVDFKFFPIERTVMFNLFKNLGVAF
jgi:hypothetical protein